MTGLETLLSELPSLSEDELKQVQATVNAMLGSTPESVQASDAPLVFLKVFKDTSLIRGVEFPPVSRLRGNREILRGVKQVAKFLDDNFRTCSRPSRIKAEKLFARLILDHAVESMSPRPVNLDAVGRSMQRIGLVCDDAFPGYAESGLLRMVIDRAA